MTVTMTVTCEYCTWRTCQRVTRGHGEELFPVSPQPPPEWVHSQLALRGLRGQPHTPRPPGLPRLPASLRPGGRSQYRRVHDTGGGGYAGGLLEPLFQSIPHARGRGQRPLCFRLMPLGASWPSGGSFLHLQSRDRRASTRPPPAFSAPSPAVAHRGSQASAPTAGASRRPPVPPGPEATARPPGWGALEPSGRNIPERGPRLARTFATAGKPRQARGWGGREDPRLSRPGGGPVRVGSLALPPTRPPGAPAWGSGGGCRLGRHPLLGLREVTRVLP